MPFEIFVFPGILCGLYGFYVGFKVIKREYKE